MYNLIMEDILQKQKPLSNEERKILSSKRIPMQVSPFEAEMIKELRTFSHGRFIVQVLDGIPIRYMVEISRMFFEGTQGFDILNKTAKAK